MYTFLPAPPYMSIIELLQTLLVKCYQPCITSQLMLNDQSHDDLIEHRSIFSTNLVDNTFDWRRRTCLFKQSLSWKSNIFSRSHDISLKYQACERTYMKLTYSWSILNRFPFHSVMFLINAIHSWIESESMRVNSIVSYGDPMYLHGAWVIDKRSNACFL